MQIPSEQISVATVINAFAALVAVGMLSILWRLYNKVRDITITFYGNPSAHGDRGIFGAVRDLTVSIGELQRSFEAHDHLEKEWQADHIRRFAMATDRIQATLSELEIRVTDSIAELRKKVEDHAA